MPLSHPCLPWKLRPGGSTGWSLAVDSYVLGAALFLGCWLARSSAMRDDTDPGSLSFFILLGALAASVGTALLLVGLIGWGVKHGREAADI